MAMFFRHMAALGFGGDFFKANPVNPLPTVAAQAVGRRARVSVKHETWQNVERAKVGNVMPGSAGGGLPGGLPPAPGVGGGLVPPPPVAQVPPVQTLMQQPAAPAPAPAPVAETAPHPGSGTGSGTGPCAGAAGPAAGAGSGPPLVLVRPLPRACPSDLRAVAATHPESRE
jgi:hypothetical protein